MADLIDPTSGEIIKPTPAGLRYIWNLEKQIKSLKKQAQSEVEKFLGDDQEYRFKDGARFVRVRREDQAVPPEHAFGIIGDVDTFIETLRDNAVDMTKAAKMAEEKRLTEVELGSLRKGLRTRVRANGEPAVSEFVRLEK